MTNERSSPHPKATVVPWQTPSLYGTPPEERPSPEPETPQASLEELRALAVSEGREAGRQEALAMVRKDIQQRLDRVDRVLAALQQPFDELTDAVAGSLVRLTVKIAEQILRTNWKSDTAMVHAMVREALTALGDVSLPVRIHLHPEDAAALRELQGLDGQGRQWHIIEDSAITPGGCELEAADSQVDARLESQLAAILDQLQVERKQPAES